MSTPNDPLHVRFGRLWKQMSSDNRLAAARAFWADGDSGEQQADAIARIAQQRNFRPKSIQSLPAEQKARSLASLPDLPDTVTARALVAYHLAAHRPMLKAFLDALEIGHDDGVISTAVAMPPSADRLSAAVRQLASQFPPADVSLYLSTLLAQDTETWGGLSGLPELGPLVQTTADAR